MGTVAPGRDRDLGRSYLGRRVGPRSPRYLPALRHSQVAAFSRDVEAPGAGYPGRCARGLAILAQPTSGSEGGRKLRDASEGAPCVNSVLPRGSLGGSCRERGRAWN